MAEVPEYVGLVMSKAVGRLHLGSSASWVVDVSIFTDLPV